MVTVRTAPPWPGAAGASGSEPSIPAAADRVRHGAVPDPHQLDEQRQPDARIRARRPGRCGDARQAEVGVLPTPNVCGQERPGSRLPSAWRRRSRPSPRRCESAVTTRRRSRTSSTAWSSACSPTTSACCRTTCSRGCCGMRFLPRRGSASGCARSRAARTSAAGAPTRHGDGRGHPPTISRRPTSRRSGISDTVSRRAPPGGCAGGDGRSAVPSLARGRRRGRAGRRPRRHRHARPRVRDGSARPLRRPRSPTLVALGLAAAAAAVLEASSRSGTAGTGTRCRDAQP